jgi:hypothetical protein
MTKYQLTNRRVMILKGWSLKPSQEVRLEEIEEVRVKDGTEQAFYLSADLEILAGGRVVLTLVGVPEFTGFKKNIEDARLAWGRKDAPKEQTHPAIELTKMKIEK